ncbi:chromo domain-containing protein [Trichonephila clavipes]|nr:chromo domain-containing protein [Trichonephila clavipes]
MVMSETHSEKRKFGKAGESSVNKKARREVSKKYGKFTEDCIPDGVFPIGDDVFVFASVHIRRFKKYGKTYYPTPEGITLDPQWIEYIMRKKKVPESLEELPSGLFPPERHIQITSENFIDFTFKRIKYSPDKEPTFKEITISREQWAEMIKKYGAIENAAIDNMFQCMDFLTAYKTFCEGPIENTLPSSLDVSLVKRCEHWLSQKDAYTLHKPVRHKFQRNRVFVSDIDRQFQADLVDMQSLAEFNKGLKDLQGEEIKGTYYEAELQKVVDSGFYPVENVIKQRKRGGITEYFVKFLGYPEKFNDWVTDIQKYK